MMTQEAEAANARRAPAARTAIPAGGGAQQASGINWIPLDLISIGVTSSKGVPRGTMGSASARVIDRFGAAGRIDSFCETPARYPLRFWFHVDADGVPRPTPFIPPRVSVSLAFTPEHGTAPTATRTESDPRPTYEGPGIPLRTTFGETLWMGSTKSGTLDVSASLADPSTGTAIRYDDTIPCRLEPCA
ncbi:hypothetical protein ACPW96_01155 [Micromonospora sp. DT81.3]|uniref:hypothetical protein n=1 Tax=Micromonospora sp. DT81.3 TaxID=3416523 RepID=UPI003CF677C0